MLKFGRYVAKNARKLLELTSHPKTLTVISDSFLPGCRVLSTSVIVCYTTMKLFIVKVIFMLINSSKDILMPGNQ